MGSLSHWGSSPILLWHLFCHFLCPYLLPSFQVAMALPATQAFEKFHRICPFLPDYKPWLVVQGQSGEFFIDHAHPFGTSCASSNAGMIANASGVWTATDVKPIRKYENDLNIFRFPLKDGLLFIFFSYVLTKVLYSNTTKNIKCGNVYQNQNTNKKQDYSLPTATVSLGRCVMPATIQAGLDSIDFGLCRQDLHFSCNFSFSIMLLIIESVSLHAR